MRVLRWACVMACVASLSACTAVDAITADAGDERERYLVNLHIEFAPQIFEPNVLPDTVIKPFDEGFIYVLDPKKAAPEEWQYSADEANNAAYPMSRVFYPIIIHPELPFLTTVKVRLPAYLCVALGVIPDNTLQAPVDKVATSTCAPVPAEFESSDEETAAKLLPASRVIDEPVHLTLDTVAAPSIFLLHAGSWDQLY